MRAALLASLVLAVACAADVSGRVPASLRLEPVDEHVQEQIVRARDQLDRGDARAALATTDAIGSVGEGVVDLQRLRQDALRQRGRLGFVRAKAAARVAADAEDPIAHYLLGRTLSGVAMRGEFERAAALAPTSIWPWLGLAFALREEAPEESLAIYARLNAAAARVPAVGIAYANALRAAGRLREAIEVYEQLVANGAVAGVGQLGLAQSLFALGTAADRQRGWSALLTVAEQRPFDPGLHAVVRELLRLGLADEQVEQLVDVLRASPERWLDFARGAGVETMVTLLARTQQVHAALRLLATAKVSARQPQLRRLQRQLLLQVGDVAAFRKLLAADLPQELLADPANQVGALWRALLDVAPPDQDPTMEPAGASRFVAALRDTGLLDEAEQAAELALRHDHNDNRDDRERADLVAVRDEVRREIAFESGLRRLLYEGYGQKGAGDLGDLLAQIRHLSLAVLGTDVVGVDARFHLPLVGEMMDPFAAGLCLHLARYNHHLALGHRAGGAVEGLMVTRLSVRDLDDLPALSVPGRCREVIGIDRSVRSLSGVLGGDLAGVALLNHYIVDHDAVAEWAAAVAARQRIAAEDGNAVLSDPVPVDTDQLDPLDVSWRLAAVSPLQDSAIAPAVLEVIRLHERRHLVDSFHYLPFEANIWRGLGLLVRFGLSPAAIEAEMERRAELAALALCREPRLVLAHIAEFTGGDELSPHARGFSQLAAELVAAFVAEGVAAGDAVMARWDRLDPGLVQRAAGRLLAQLP